MQLGYGIFKSALNAIKGAFTAGSVLFAGSDGGITEDNSGLFFDSANGRLGIGTSTPDAALEIDLAAAGNFIDLQYGGGTKVAIAQNGQIITNAASAFMSYGAVTLFSHNGTEIELGKAGYWTALNLYVANTLVAGLVVTPPVSSSSTGSAGQIAFDADYFYRCTATDTWKRTAWGETSW